MTAKEKAKELYLKYCPYDIIYCDPLGHELDGYYERYAKQCAIMMVEEIIKSIPEQHMEKHLYLAEVGKWVEIKWEIEKI